MLKIEWIILNSKKEFDSRCIKVYFIYLKSKLMRPRARQIVTVQCFRQWPLHLASKLSPPASHLFIHPSSFIPALVPSFLCRACSVGQAWGSISLRFRPALSDFIELIDFIYGQSPYKRRAVGRSNGLQQHTSISQSQGVISARR